LSSTLFDFFYKTTCAETGANKVAELLRCLVVVELGRAVAATGFLLALDRDAAFRHGVFHGWTPWANVFFGAVVATGLFTLGQLLLISLFDVLTMRVAASLEIPLNYFVEAFFLQSTEYQPGNALLLASLCALAAAFGCAAMDLQRHGQKEVSSQLQNILDAMAIMKSSRQDRRRHAWSGLVPTDEEGPGKKHWRKAARLVSRAQKTASLNDSATQFEDATVAGAGHDTLEEGHAQLNAESCRGNSRNPPSDDLLAVLPGFACIRAQRGLLLERASCGASSPAVQ
jgi:hypothetical protein